MPLDGEALATEKLSGRAYAPVSGRKNVFIDGER